MKQTVCLLFSLLIFLQTPEAQTFDPDYRDGVIYVKVKDSLDTQLVDSITGIWHPYMDSLKPIYNIDSIWRPFKAKETGFIRTYCVRFKDTGKVTNLIQDCNNHTCVEYSEMIPLILTTHIPNDFKANQWYLTKINAPVAWDFSTGSSSVVIAIVDNGVRTTHTDLKDNLWQNIIEKNGLAGIDDDLNGYIDDINGYDFSDNDNDPNPPTTSTTGFSHGTHVAGTASATTNNSTGVSSVGYNTSIMALKCAPSSSDGGQLDAVYEGIEYAATMGAEVINMSFGGKHYAKTHEAIIAYAHKKGAVLVAAAGNSNTDTAFYPAAYPHVIAVGATNELDKRASFSNYGSYVDVMAPGTDIYNTLGRNDNDYGSLQGTSMASPIVAGLAGLLRSYKPNLTTAQVETFIEQGAENIDALNPGYAGKLGAGRMNAANSMLKATSIFETMSDNSALLIYPNPVNSGDIFIDATMLPGEKAIELFNSIGQTISIKKDTGNKISIENPGAGFYTIRIIVEGKSYSKKIIVN